MKADQLPEDVRVLNVLGAEYYIPWEDLSRGRSFFIPTTATAKQVHAATARAREYLQISLEVRSRCENGLYGARIWRTY